MSVLKEQILLLLFWITTSLLDILKLTPPSRLEDLNENNKKVRDEYEANEVWISALPFYVVVRWSSALKKKIIDSQRHLT